MGFYCKILNVRQKCIRLFKECYKLPLQINWFFPGSQNNVQEAQILPDIERLQITNAHTLKEGRQYLKNCCIHPCSIDTLPAVCPYSLFTFIHLSGELQMYFNPS